MAHTKLLAAVPLRDSSCAFLILRGERVLIYAQLTAEEWTTLRSQIVTLTAGHVQHRKYLAYNFI